MIEGFKEKRLGDILSLEYGKGLPKADRDPLGPYCVAGSNGINGMHTDFLVEGPGIVVGRKGSAGKVTWFDNGFWPIDTTYYIRPKEDANMKWCFYLLKSLRLERLANGAAVPGLNRELAYKSKVLLPTPDEQKRIAAILDKADAIRQKRKEALKLTEELLRSTFLEMFGIKRSEFYNWEPTAIKDLVADKKGSVRSGPFGSALKHSEFVEDGIAVLGIDNAVDNVFKWGQRRFITPEKYEVLRRYRVYPRDVIITIMGTIGRSAVVPDNIRESITTKHLAVLTLDESKALPEYISSAFQYDPYLLEQVSMKNRGAVMPGLNLGIIKEIRLRLPPPDLQMKFREVARKIVSTSATQKMSLLDSKNNFNSLVQRAFKGEL